MPDHNKHERMTEGVLNNSGLGLGGPTYNFYGTTGTGNQYLHQSELIERLQEKVSSLKEEVET